MKRDLTDSERAVLAHVVIDPDEWWEHACNGYRANCEQHACAALTTEAARTIADTKRRIEMADFAVVAHRAELAAAEARLAAARSRAPQGLTIAQADANIAAAQDKLTVLVASRAMLTTTENFVAEAEREKVRQAIAATTTEIATETARRGAARADLAVLQMVEGAAVYVESMKLIVANAERRRASLADTIAQAETDLATVAARAEMCGWEACEKALADKVARWKPDYEAAIAAGNYKTRAEREAK